MAIKHLLQAIWETNVIELTAEQCLGLLPKATIKPDAASCRSGATEGSVKSLTAASVQVSINSLSSIFSPHSRTMFSAVLYSMDCTCTCEEGKGKKL